MVRFLKKYLPFTNAALQTFTTYRFNFFFFMFGRLLRVFVTLYLWSAIFKSSGESNLADFSAGEILLYIITADIAANIIMSPTILEVIPNEVRSGLISMNLIKPINYHFQVFFSSLGNLIIVFTCYGLPVFIISHIYLYFNYSIPFVSLSNLLFFIISFLLSYLIYFFFSFSIATISFYTTSIWGISVAVFAVINFLSGRMIPIDFFSGNIKYIIQFLPFASMIYTPVMIYTGKLTGNSMIIMLALQSLWALVITLISLGVWRNAIKKLTILGG